MGIVARVANVGRRFGAPPRDCPGREAAGGRGSGGARRRCGRRTGAFPVGDRAGVAPGTADVAAGPARRCAGGESPGRAPIASPGGAGLRSAAAPPSPGWAPRSVPKSRSGRGRSGSRAGPPRRRPHAGRSRWRFEETRAHGIAGAGGDSGSRGSLRQAPSGPAGLRAITPGALAGPTPGDGVTRGARDQRSSWLARTLPPVRTTMRRVPRCRSGGRFQNG